MKKLLAFLIILFSFKSYGQDETKKFIIKSKDASICDGGKINLSVDVSIETANGLNEKLGVLDNNYFEQIRHSINWYNEASGGDNIGKGISFTTPEISNTKTYYASVNYSGGLPVISDDYKKVDGEGLIFNLTTPTLINSVDVYSNMPGKISVVIKKSDGTQIISKPFTLINGLNKLPLNCSLPSGLGFTIEAFGLSPDIKLTTIKHDIWPITLGKFGQIVEGTKNKKKYNYFFNWDVSTERVPVSASIIKSTQNIITKSECDKYFWTETSETYDKSGTYTKVYGCHTEKLNLTITPSSKKTEEITACDSYIWNANNQKYLISGTYSSISNCLTKELVLTLEPSATNVTTQSAVDSFTWGINNKKYEVSGTYIETQGCVTEKLILNLSFSDTTNLITTAKTQTFKEVKIGNQIWMKENLNVDHFRNGDPIAEPNTSDEFERILKYDLPYWRYYNKVKNGSLIATSEKDKLKTYGKMYNVRAIIDPRGLAPEGWHIPTEAEWKTLIDYLGGDDKAGAKLKSSTGWESYTTGGAKTCPHCKNWNSAYRNQVPCHTCKNTRFVPAPTQTHSSNGSNSSGFTAFPAGHGINTIFEEGVAGQNIGYWSSSWGMFEDYSEQKKQKWVQIDKYNHLKFDYILYDGKGDYGHENTHVFYIRCIKD